MSAVRELDVFLLSAEWRDTARGLELTLWGSSLEGPVRATLTGQEAVMFVPRDAQTQAGRRVPRALRSREGTDVDAVYFTTQRALLQERERIQAEHGLTFEADLKPHHRFLMERFVNGGFTVKGPARLEQGVLRFTNPQVHAADVTPRLRTLSLDIETDGWDGPVLSIALAGSGLEHVFIARAAPEADGNGAPTSVHPERGAPVHPERGSPVHPERSRGISFHGTERATLEAAFEAIRTADPDAILGWNVTDFDLRVLDARCLALGIPFAIGRMSERARVLLGEGAQSVSIARVPGRVVLDGVATLKNASWAFERYTLDHVAKQLLGRGKLRAEGVDALAEIRRMYRDDPAALAAYNLEDARLALELFEKAELVEFTVARAKLTGLPLDRQGGSVAAFDYLYLPRLHRRGFVAHDVGVHDPAPSPGGHVLDSVPGLYTHVASFDFRSLYPSIIRTFQIDPLGLWFPGENPVSGPSTSLRTGFEGAKFARTGAILPELITHLHEERTRAREANNETLSRAIKILMNSFYGVLGTPGCRFFDPRLATSITLRGREIIERSQKFLEDHGFPVLYGDTDSLFVRLDSQRDEAAAQAEGKRLADSLNAFWRERVREEHGLESFLELRFDALFLKFLMPTMRGSEKGSKKRYAGTVRAPDGGTKLVIRGLEAIRTDWTPLAREAQRELLERVFTEKPWEAWLLSLRERLLKGELDDQLVYRKRLRRGMSDYASVPPHVRAAKLLEAEEGDDTHASEVEYVMTTRGPEPVSLRTAGIDYTHYLEKQLAPAVDVVLGQLGSSFERVAGTQLTLF